MGNAYMFFSLLGQFATHMGSMYVGMRMAQSYTTLQTDPDLKFEPNVLNTVVYLLSSVQMAATFAANYIGKPFMTDLTGNTGLIRGLAGLVIPCMICATNLISPLDYMLD